MASKLLRQLRNEIPYETRRRRFFAKAKFVSVAFMVGGVLGALSTYWASQWGTPLRDAQGGIVDKSAIYIQCLTFLGGSILGLVAFVVLRKFSRR